MLLLRRPTTAPDVVFCEAAYAASRGGAAAANDGWAASAGSGGVKRAGHDYGACATFALFALLLGMAHGAVAGPPTWCKGTAARWAGPAFCTTRYCVKAELPVWLLFALASVKAH